MRHQVATFCFRPEFCTCGTVGWEKKKGLPAIQKNKPLEKILQQLGCKRPYNRISTISTPLPKNCKDEDFHSTLTKRHDFLRTAGVKLSAPGFLKPKNCPNKDSHQRAPQPLLQGFSTGVARSYKNPVFSTKNMSRRKEKN